MWAGVCNLSLGFIRETIDTQTHTHTRKQTTNWILLHNTSTPSHLHPYTAATMKQHRIGIMYNSQQTSQACSITVAILVVCVYII